MSANAQTGSYECRLHVPHLRRQSARLAAQAAVLEVCRRYGVAYYQCAVVAEMHHNLIADSCVSVRMRQLEIDTRCRTWPRVRVGGEDR